MEKKIKHTNIRYVGLALVFILLGLGLVFLPDKDNTKKTGTINITYKAE